MDHEAIAKKCREILWRQGCYNSVSKLKKILRDQPTKGGGNLTADELDALKRFLFDVIKEYRQIILNFEYRFKMDLRYLIDFNLIGRKETNGWDDLAGQDKDADEQSVATMDYAQKTVQFLLIALGDIHRYLNDFQVELLGGAASPFECALKFYRSAFVLNPLNGMAQNQLGTLMVDKCFDIDSIFHYLFSLMCQIPFDLSESNLNKIFQKNIDYIETITEKETTTSMTPINDKMSLKNFISRFILVVDIYYFDKVVYDFNSLCHFVLVELKRLLGARISDVDAQFLFKLTSILFFCMSHLKLKSSEKIHNLNAFMVALTSELIDSCTRNFERDVLEFTNEDSEFNREYRRLYDDEFERRQTDDASKQIINLGKKPSSKSQSSVEYNNEVKSGKSNTEENVVNSSSQNKSKIPPGKDRRRRRRVHTSSSSVSSFSTQQSDDDDLNSNFESDYEGSADDDDEDLSSMSSDKEDGDDGADENNDVPAVNLQLEQFTLNDLDVNSEDDVIVEEEKIMFIDDNDDIIVEEETICNVERSSSPGPSPPAEENDYPIPNGIQRSERRCRSERRRRLPKYTKIDPNLILRFAATEKTLKPLKLLFDWLRNNIEILINCYTTNPEFFQKIMKLLNYLNIDVFTKTVFFDLSLIKTDELRPDLTSLFENRHRLPVTEDIDLKGFIMFEANQSTLDWNMKAKLEITEAEESFVRISKIVDFGFFLTKSHKFNYVFCKKSRNFIEETRQGRGARGNRRVGRGRRMGKRIRNRFRANRSRNRDRGMNGGHEKRYGKENGRYEETNGDRLMVVDVKENTDKKGFSEKDKYEIMGKLWLRNEVETLESKVC